MTREELDLSERQPSQALRDMRLVYDGELDNVSQPVTKSQRMLEKLYEENPDKFMLRMERLQLSHDKKVMAIEARELGQGIPNMAGVYEENVQQAVVVVIEERDSPGHGLDQVFSGGR